MESDLIVKVKKAKEAARKFHEDQHNHQLSVEAGTSLAAALMALCFEIVGKEGEDKISRIELENALASFNFARDSIINNAGLKEDLG